MVDLVELYQCSIFDELFEKKVITKKIRLIELFSGIGAQAKALEILNIPFEHYLTCEWAYNSIVGYNAIHIKDKTDYAKDMTKEQLLSYLNGNISIDYNKPADLTKKSIEWLKNCYNNVIATHDLMNIMNVKGRDLGVFDKDYEYILTYSFPCQDLSLAGKRSGMETSQSEGGTRSGLLWEVERILLERKRDNLDLPGVLLMENVPEVVGTKNDNHFYKWCNQLSKLGYQNYFKILNAKNYGIPQNRKRCFMISILGDYTYDFPKKLTLKHKLKDLLDKNVDEKYYLSKKMFDYLTGINQKESKYDRGSVFERNFNPKKEIAATITTAAGQRATDNFVVEGYNNKRLNENLESNNVKDGDFIDAYNKTVNSEVVGTITTRVSDSNCTFIAVKNNLRIRKLTPCECIKLMGFERKDYESLVEYGLSDSAIYHCAGDSIVATVLVGLFGTMTNKDYEQIIKDYAERIAND